MFRLTTFVLGVGLLLAAGVAMPRAAQAQAQAQAPAQAQAQAQTQTALEEPALPAGLDDANDEPQLPSGLGDEDDEPGLPSGLGGGDATDDGDEGGAASISSGLSQPFVDWKMVLDMRAGARTQSDPYEDRASLGEARLQIQLSKSWTPWSTGVQLTTDFLFDSVAGEYTPDLETGAGAIDLRAANIVTSPASFLDVKIGRQALTWGTGDLLFINDMFPKDWNAFLIGRDLEYLKAPSDAVKLAVFTPKVAFDLVITPRFDPDRIPERGRLSSWDPAQGRIAGEDAPITMELPDRWLSDAEVAGRAYRNVGAWELAAYGYYGFWKSPAGANPMTGAATNPALSVYGASARGTVRGGIASAEVGYYDSRDDRKGKDPMVRNSEFRGLIGYERSVSKNLTASAQYYVERMRYHKAYTSGLPPMAPATDATRHLLTLRLYWLTMSQNLHTSLFVFASPSDRDGYVRPSVQYQIDDNWRAGVAGNVFFGKEDHTFFGQLRNNTNVFASLRYAR